MKAGTYLYAGLAEMVLGRGKEKAEEAAYWESRRDLPRLNSSKSTTF